LFASLAKDFEGLIGYLLTFMSHIFPPPLRREGLPASGGRAVALELINQLTRYNCMGLDMLLEKKRYVQNWDWMEAEDRYQVTVLRGGRPTVIRAERVSEVVEEGVGANPTPSIADS
jgi:hypothetical protein